MGAISRGALFSLLAALPLANLQAQSKVVYGGWDVTERSSAFYIGGVAALNGNINVSGGVLSGSLTKATYDYDTVAVAENTVDVDLTSGNALLGYQWVNRSTSMTLSAGIDYQDHSLTPDDPSSVVKGNKTGGVVQLEIMKFTTPVDASLIAKASEVFGSYWARGRLGYKIGKVKTGIELTGSGNDSYDNERYGLYATFPISGSLSVDLAAGDSTITGKNSVQDSDSAYATLGLVTLF